MKSFTFKNSILFVYVFSVFGIFGVFLGGCAHSHHSAAGIEKGKMGGVEFAYRSKTYFMEQPTIATLDETKAAGITTIINLRTDDEMKGVDYNMPAEAKKRGLNYYHFPIDPKLSLSKETLAKIESTYMSHHKKGEKVIVHCASGQRAAAWFAYHIRFTHGDSADQALKDAKEIGLNSPQLTEKVKAVIQ